MLFPFEFTGPELDLLQKAVGYLEQEMTQREHDELAEPLLTVKSKLFKRR